MDILDGLTVDTMYVFVSQVRTPVFNLCCYRRQSACHNLYRSLVRMFFQREAEVLLRCELHCEVLGKIEPVRQKMCVVDFVVVPQCRVRRRRGFVVIPYFSNG